MTGIVFCFENFERVSCSLHNRVTNKFLHMAENDPNKPTRIPLLYRNIFQIFSSKKVPVNLACGHTICRCCLKKLDRSNCSLDEVYEKISKKNRTVE